MRRVLLYLGMSLLLGSLWACNDSGVSSVPLVAKPRLPDDEVVLAPDSSKRAMVREAVLSLTEAPVMEPVAGKIAYDETVTARVFAPVAGRVISKLPVSGIRVEARDPLVELDSPELGKAKEDYANAMADLRLAEDAFRRAQSLHEHAVLSRKALQEAENVLAHARGDVSQSLMRLRNLDVPGDQINNRYWVRSPIAGIITEQHINPGLEVRPDLPQPLFVISDLSRLWVYLNVFEKDIGKIRVGSEVSVAVLAYPEEKFEATVEYIDKLVDEETRSIKVRCRMRNPALKLLPSMYATVDILSGPEDRALVLPLTALFTEGEGDQVFVRIGEGHYKQREVHIKLRLRDRAVIDRGLMEGETVVTEGALLLRTEEANEQSDPTPSR